MSRKLVHCPRLGRVAHRRKSRANQYPTRQHWDIQAVGAPLTCFAYSWSTPCLLDCIPAHSVLPTSTFLSGVETRLATNGRSSQEWEPCFTTGSSETIISDTPMSAKVLTLEYRLRSYCDSVRHCNRSIAFLTG